MLKIECEIICDDCGRGDKGKFAHIQNVGIDHDEFYFHGYSKYIQCKSCFDEANSKWMAYKKTRGFFQRFNGAWFYDFCPGFKGWKSGVVK